MYAANKDHIEYGNPYPERQMVYILFLCEAPNSKSPDMNMYLGIAAEPRKVKKDHCRSEVSWKQQRTEKEG